MQTLPYKQGDTQYTATLDVNGSLTRSLFKFPSVRIGGTTTEFKRSLFTYFLHLEPFSPSHRLGRVEEISSP